MNIEIRRVEPGDYKAVQQVHAQPNALRGTLQLVRRKRGNRTTFGREQTLCHGASRDLRRRTVW